MTDGKLIVRRKPPFKRPVKTRIESLGFIQKLYWCYLFATAQANSKKTYDKPDDVAADLFGRERPTIVGWNDQLELAKVIQYSRKGERNPATGKYLPNIFKVQKPTPEIYAQVQAVIDAAAVPCRTSDTEQAVGNNGRAAIGRRVENPTYKQPSLTTSVANNPLQADDAHYKQLVVRCRKSDTVERLVTLRQALAGMKGYAKASDVAAEGWAPSIREAQEEIREREAELRQDFERELAGLGGGQ